MTRFEQMMRSYESIHQSPINRAIHAIGIPMIMVSLVGLAALLRAPVSAPLAPYADAATLLVVAASAIVFSWSLRAGLGFLALALACLVGSRLIAAHVGVSAPWVFAIGFVAGWA
jgi:uncharacterized membrane protein YGL010W